MVLSDGEILQRLYSAKKLPMWMMVALLRRGHILLDPFPSTTQLLLGRIGTISLDLHLSNTFTQHIPPEDGQPVDIMDENDRQRIKYKHIVVGKDVSKYYILEPNEFVLGLSQEFIGLPADLYADINDKSILARHGVTICFNSRKIDAGFIGKVVFEIKNHGPYRIILRPGMRICQLIFHEIGGDVLFPYFDSELSTWLGQTETLREREPAESAC